MRPDSRSALIHYMRSLALPEAVCGDTAASTITLDAAQVTCTRCHKKLPLAAFPEKELLARVRFMARQYGWRCYHTHNSKRSEPGFPDLCMVKVPRLIFAELKREGESPTIEQEAWLAALGAIPGVLACLWYPSDLPHIITLLTEV